MVKEVLRLYDSSSMVEQSTGVTNFRTRVSGPQPLGRGAEIDAERQRSLREVGLELAAPSKSVDI